MNKQIAIKAHREFVNEGNLLHANRIYKALLRGTKLVLCMGDIDMEIEQKLDGLGGSFKYPYSGYSVYFYINA